MNNNYEIELYKELAKEIKPQGFRIFLYNKENTAWVYIITPDNSWLYVDRAEYGGFIIDYNYHPSKDLGSGCRYNEKPLSEITAETLLKAEQYGKQYGYKGWTNVPNKYDGGTHSENVWKTPTHYKDGYKAMMNCWCAEKLQEL